MTKLWQTPTDSNRTRVVLEASLRAKREIYKNDKTITIDLMIHLVPSVGFEPTTPHGSLGSEPSDFTKLSTRGILLKFVFGASDGTRTRKSQDS